MLVECLVIGIIDFFFMGVVYLNVFIKCVIDLSHTSKYSANAKYKYHSDADGIISISG